MADDDLMNQDEIERLLNQAGKDVAPAGDAAPEGSGNPPSGDLPSPAAEAQEAAPASGGAATALGQEEIEKLLGKAETATAEAAAPPATAQRGSASDVPVAEGSLPQSDIEYLLNQAEAALESVNSTASGDLPQGVSSFRLEEFSGAPASSEVATLDLVRDVELDLKIELGRTHMYLEDVLKLRKGSVVPLDKLAGDPVDIYVNGRLIARGEVLVLNDNFCVRVAELIAGTNAFA